jgi:hypothetical protein
MISIPKKTTEDVDWTTPIRNLIAQSYGENPDNYATECNTLQRCRQDAVRGAGSDLTGKILFLLSVNLPSTDSDRPSPSARSPLQVLWATGAPGASFLRDQG